MPRYLVSITEDGNTYEIPSGGGASYTGGTGISITGTTINHSNSVTAQSTLAVYPITYDAQGHITGSGSAVTIPVNVSQLNNDSGYLTLATLPIYDGSVITV